MWLLLAVLGAAPDVKQQATEAFKKGKLDRACALFAQVVSADPKDAAGWSDLGLCLARQGKKPAAVDALDRAIALGDLETRKHAYYNLGKYGLRAAALGALDSDEASKPFEHPAGCGRHAGVRFRSFSSMGSDYANGSDGLWVGGPSWLAAEHEEGDDFNVPLWSFSEPSGPHCGSCDPCSLRARKEGRRASDAEALRPRIARCEDARQKGCRFADAGADCEAVVTDCEYTACDEVEGTDDHPLSAAQKAALGKQERAFLAEVLECSRKCDADFTPPPSASDSPWFGCSLVSVNACAMQVGFVCPDKQGKGVHAEEAPIRNLPAPDGGT